MTQNTPVPRAIVKRKEVNTLTPHSTKQIMDELVLAIFDSAGEQSLSVVGTFGGWTEPGTMDGHLTFVAKGDVRPFDQVNHTKWMSYGTTLCQDPQQDDFVINQSYHDRPFCAKCSMLLAARSQLSRNEDL